jgi:hypothetical protein
MCSVRTTKNYIRNCSFLRIHTIFRTFPSAFAAFQKHKHCQFWQIRNFCCEIVWMYWVQVTFVATQETKILVEIQHTAVGYIHVQHPNVWSSSRHIRFPQTDPPRGKHLEKLVRKNQTPSSRTKHILRDFSIFFFRVCLSKLIFRWFYDFFSIVMSSGTILSQKVSQKYSENLQKNSENEM